MKQTAIEWLFDQMSNVAAGYVTELNEQEILDKAKAMEKEQIVQAHGSASSDAGYEHSADDWANEYYDKTFNL